MGRTRLFHHGDRGGHGDTPRQVIGAGSRQSRQFPQMTNRLGRAAVPPEFVIGHWSSIICHFGAKCAVVIEVALWKPVPATKTHDGLNRVQLDSRRGERGSCVSPGISKAR